MKRFLLNVLLFLVALLLFLLLLPINIIYSIVTRTWPRASIYFFTLAKSIDQTGNVLMSPIFNDWFIKPWLHSFGDMDETISYVLKVNELGSMLRFPWKVLYRIINMIDPWHFINIADWLWLKI